MTTRHHRAAAVAGALIACLAAGTAATAQGPAWSPGPAEWAGDLTPITAADWNADRAAHLLGRAGFGGVPEEIAELAGLGPK